MIATVGAEVSPARSVVVVVVCVTFTLFAVEVLEVKSAAVVGVNVAVRESGLPSGSAVVARVAFPLVTVAEVPT